MTNVSTTKLTNTRINLIISLLLSLGAFLLYWQATAPSVATIFDDSLEFPLVVHRLAIAHPTGYPLYTLLGKVFSLFNPGNVAYQLNLMSAFFAALTVGLLYLVGLALYPAKAKHWGQKAGAILGATLFGLGPIFFSQATLAEVYSLHSFLLALILLLTLKKRWLWLAFCFGLGLSHHRTTLLLAPAIALYLFVEYRLFTRQGWKDFGQVVSPLKLIGAFLAPLLLYLYLPLRGEIGTLEGTYLNTWAGFWEHINGGGYSAFLWGNPFDNQRDFSFYLILLTQELGWWGLILGGIGGLWLALKRCWPQLILTAVALFTFFIFNLFYTVSDIEVFFIPVFLILAIWAGLALGLFLTRLEALNRYAMLAVATGVLLMLLAMAKGESRANEWAVHDYAIDALSQSKANSAIVGIQGEMTLLRYFQEVQDIRPDVATHRADSEAERLATLSALLGATPDAPVYLTRELAGLPGEWSLSAEGPLIAVYPHPLNTAPPFETPVNAPLTPEISLAGYTISRPPSHTSPPPLRLSLVWQVNQPVGANLKVSARLLNPAGEIASVIDKIPVHFAYPTSAWKGGEFISDVYDLQLPASAPNDSYTPLIILYDPANNAAEVGRITLNPVWLE